MARLARPGRPPLPASERRGVISLRVSPEERERWQRAADDEGQTLGEWLREAADAALEAPRATVAPSSQGAG